MRPFLAKKIAAATEPLVSTLATLQVVTGSEAATVDERLLTLRTDLSGQATLIGPRMRLRDTALRVDALEGVVATLNAQLTTLASAMAAQFAGLAPRLEIAEANALLSLANDARNATAIQAADARAAAATSKAEAADAKATAARLVADADLLATAEARALAVTAQAKADAAALLAAEGKTAAADAKALAADAKLAAQTAAANLATLQNRFRGKLVATPPVTLAINGSKSVAVVWDTPFADANYEIELTPQGLSLLGVRLSYQDKTAAGFTLLLTNLGTLSLALAAGVVDATALHN